MIFTNPAPNGAGFSFFVENSRFVYYNLCMKKRKTIVVNLFGGPGVGKTSMRADVFAKLKWENIECEESVEYVKPKVWEDSLNSIKDQIYVFGQQHNQLFRLRDKVDVIITDAPLINSFLYDKENNKIFRALVLQEFKKYDNLNFIINRTKPYNPKGRFQDEQGAQVVHLEVYKILKKNKIPFEIVGGGPKGVPVIVDAVLKHLKKTGR